MRYDDDFRATVLQDLEESGDAIAVVARRHNIAHSTLLRWREAQTRQPSPAADFAQDPIDALLERIGRDVRQVRAEFDARRSKHTAAQQVYYRVTLLVDYVFWFAVGLLGWLFGSLIVDAWQGESPESLPFALVVSGVGLLGLWLLYLLSRWLLERLFSLAGPFAFTTSAIETASRTLQHSSAALWLDDSMWHRLQSARTRRRLRGALKDAERNLSRRSVLGRSFKTLAAREWELGCRRRVAATLGYVEIILELYRGQAVQSALRHLDEVWGLTMLRDWSYEDLPTIEDQGGRYQAPLARAASVLWRPVPVLGLVLGLAGSAIPVWEWASGLR